MDPTCWRRLPMAMIAYTTEFLNVVEEEEWILWWKNWKKTTKITIRKEIFLTLERHVNGVLHSLSDICTTRSNGTKHWYRHGKKHREGDKPALETLHGYLEWWWHGLRHREEDKPAIQQRNGFQEWWRKGVLTKRHRPSSVF
jgi:hypothetical protein